MHERLLLPEATLRYAGHAFHFWSPDSSARFAIRTPHTHFLVPRVTHSTESFEVACRIGDPEPARSRVVFDSGGIWELRGTPDGGDEVCFYTATEAGGRRPLIRVHLDPGLRGADVVHGPLPGDGRTIPIGFPLDEYLAARVLGRAGGLIVHGCALELDGEALVFIGHSGAGKSTIAELAEGIGARVLSDDRTIITIDGSGPRAWGTPWHGTYTRGSPDSAPLCALFLLVKAPLDDVLPLDRACAFKELLVRLVQPTVDRGELLGAMDGIERLVEAVPAAELRFRPTATAYALARHYAAGAVAAAGG
ncbi:MAG: hypothetical protein M3373_01075 [Gemmatimonadota bacterium]|nr:hypothetical protein [Gemmatimonadota bacterium]